MRWDELFADLDARAVAIERAERQQEIVERYRMEAGAITLLSRLTASVTKTARIQLVTGSTIVGVIDHVGSDWLLVVDERAREWVISLGAVQLVRGLGRASAPTDRHPAVHAGLGMRSVLRAIAQDRSGVSVQLADGSTVVGMIDRVGLDHCDLSTVPGERHRALHGRESTAIAIGNLVSVTRQPG